MLDVIIALLPAFAWGVYVFGIRALAIGLVCVGACIGFEAAAQFLMGRRITVSDMSAAVTGLLLAMNLPVTVPLWMPVVGAFFAIVIVKQLFGGIGKNFVNCFKGFFCWRNSGNSKGQCSFGYRRYFCLSICDRLYRFRNSVRTTTAGGSFLDTADVGVKGLCLRNIFRW